MFFKKKKELLYKENILVDSKATTQEEVIRELGQMLVNSGYVGTPYIEAMLEREKTFSTFMGNGLALPHGVEAAKKEVKESGIAVMTFPNGILWGEEMAYIIIAIAGVGESHLEILGIIAEKMMDEETAQVIINGDPDTIYKCLK